jgi:hypothetical protein
LKFIKEFIKPLFGGEQLVYQKTPTFRVHLVNNLSVGEFHKDSDYGHGTNEINFWLPFVDTFSTNTIWVESGPELEDYTPKSLDYGEILKFDGANLLHGNKINDTGITRVSVDFRVVKYSEFEFKTTPRTLALITLLDSESIALRADEFDDEEPPEIAATPDLSIIYLYFL